MACPVQFFALLFSQFIIGSRIVSATVFTIRNNCGKVIWPATLASSGGILGNGGFQLAPGQSIQLPSPPSWSGRFWARTGCNFDSAGDGNCATGNCGGGLRCRAGGQPPVSLAEFTLANGNNPKDFYDISLVDGFNLPVEVQPTGGAGSLSAKCAANINQICLAELRVIVAGQVVACKSACLAFNKPEYCCTGDHSTPATCPQTNYSQIFKKACPDAYSYAYDDKTSTRACAGTDYLITFCPS